MTTTITFDSDGRLTVPSSWLTVTPDIAGKIRCTPDGRAFGLLAQFGGTQHGGGMRGVRLVSAASVDLSHANQAIVTPQDSADPVAVSVLAYGPRHFDGNELAKPQNAMLIGRVEATPAGLAFAGCIHPEALKSRTLGEAVGLVNASPWSLEGQLKPGPMGKVVHLGHALSQAAKHVIGAAVIFPGEPLDHPVAAADDGTEVELMCVEPVSSLPRISRPFDTVAAADAPALPDDFDARVAAEVARQLQAREAEQAQRAAIAAAVSTEGLDFPS